MKKLLPKLLLAILILVGVGADGVRIQISGRNNGAGVPLPTGNVWTLVASNMTVGASAVCPGGNIGDIIIIWHGFETATTLNFITNNAEGVLTLRGSQSDHASGLHCHIGTQVAAATGSGNITANYSGGTAAFQTWVIWRYSVSGTVTYGTSLTANGTGTAISVGTFTTPTLNGVIIGGVGPGGGSTHSAFAYGGNTAIKLDVPTSSSMGAYYAHTTSMSGASFVDTLNTSQSWVAKILPLSAQ